MIANLPPALKKEKDAFLCRRLEKKAANRHTVIISNINNTTIVRLPNAKALRGDKTGSNCPNDHECLNLLFGDLVLIFHQSVIPTQL